MNPRTRLLAPFVRASSLHAGAAAAIASLRAELVSAQQLASSDVDAAYAVARITPGTNLLAVYTLLGHHIGGWPLALQALAVGVLIPAAIALAFGIAYTHAGAGWLAALMRGARAGGVAVFIGAAIRLARPHTSENCTKAFVLAAGALGVALLNVGTFWILSSAAVAGAVALKPR